MDKQSFIEEYRVNSGMSEDEMKEFMKTQLVIPCKCNYKECKGWAMVTNNEQSINAHLDIYINNT